MSRVTVTFMMIGLLVGPPALCRAGVLVDCCDHVADRGSSMAETREVPASPCCAEKCSKDDREQRDPESAPRKCGACAGICATVAKPADGPDDAAVAAVAAPVDYAIAPPEPAQAVSGLAPVPPEPNLPFPPGELPLLI